MNLPPDHIRIMGKEWTLKCRSDLIETHQAYGLTETAELRILYTDACTPSQVRDTVLHEAIHAVEETMGLGLTEPQVHALAAGLYALFADNPEFTAWLLRS